MTEPLITTCAGFSLQKVGGRCSRRETCRRFLDRTMHDAYPHDGYLCAVGKWDWFYPVDAGVNEKP